MKKILTKLSLKTVCELDFKAGENMYMIFPDPDKFGCIASKDYNYTGRHFGINGNKYSVTIDGEIVDSYIYANDITGTIVRYERDQYGKIVFDTENGVNNEILRGNVKINTVNNIKEL